MVAFDENRASSAPADDHEILDEKRAEENSDTSSTTKAENDTNLEGTENVAPHESRHPRFGENQMYSNNNDGSQELPGVEKAGTYDKIELTEDMCYDELGYAFPEWRKWCVLLRRSSLDTNLQTT
jgi:hypothetical protein